MISEEVVKKQNMELYRATFCSHSRGVEMELPH